MKDLSNKGGYATPTATAMQVGDVEIWYQHNLDENKVFLQKASTVEAAKRQVSIIYDLMQCLKDSGQIADYGTNNSGGYNTLSPSNEKLKTVIRDESADKELNEAAPKEGDLRLWYVQMFDSRDFFYADVANPSEAMAQLLVIYNLALFLYDNDQIPDYCNAGGLEVYESDGDGGYEWCEWCSDIGLDITESIDADEDEDEDEEAE